MQSAHSNTAPSTDAADRGCPRSPPTTAVSCVPSAIRLSGRAGKAYRCRGSGGLGGLTASPPAPLRMERGVKCHVCSEHPGHIVAVAALKVFSHLLFSSSFFIFLLLPLSHLFVSSFLLPLFCLISSSFTFVFVLFFVHSDAKQAYSILISLYGGYLANISATLTDGTARFTFSSPCRSIDRQTACRRPMADVCACTTAGSSRPKSSN